MNYRSEFIPETIQIKHLIFFNRFPTTASGYLMINESTANPCLGSEP